MKKKIIVIIFALMLVLGLGVIIGNAATAPKATGYSEIITPMDTTTNFFTQPLNQEKMEITDDISYVTKKGYIKVAETESLTLYLYKKNMSIALLDKTIGYMWYSDYKDLSSLNLVAANQQKIQSGVSIEYFDGNSGVISAVETSLLTKKSKGSVEYEDILDSNNKKIGFKAMINFEALGISFDVNVTINENDLIVDVPYTSIKEVTVGTLNPKNYQLKAIEVFPYFGSQNYKINGYAFIPDGSGALIRYQDVNATSAFIKTVYGNDDGVFKTEKSNVHIIDDSPISLPIYGINHGYNQAAFLCEITSGDGTAELHSYPYNYRSLPLNTTFFKLGVRDKFMVTLSSSSMTLINETPYPNNYALKYSFLNNENANYVGMAKEFASHLNMEQTVNEGNIPLHLTALGADYKEGLFGKNFIEMTTYEDAENILGDLLENNVSNIHLSYLGWNKGGYFNNGAINAKSMSSLGGNNGLKSLNDFINSNNLSADYVINPLIANVFGYGNETIKGINLTPFDTKLKSSLEQEAYYRAPNVLSKVILDKEAKYEKLGITGFNIDHLTDSFSYRYKNELYYRTQMIELLKQQIEQMSKYDISTSKAKSYLYRYLTNYYDADYECSKFVYETDSIPFISIVLSGNVNLFTTNINYISDYNLFVLRMIEYNLYPSFIITEEEAYDLRFTNYEYLNSTEYALWKELIIDIYTRVNNILKHVKGAEISNHYYIAEGVAVVEYSNNHKIYVNYNDKPFNNGSVNLEPYQYCVEGGSNA